CRTAVSPAPARSRSRRHAPPVTAPARASLAVLPRQGILSLRKLPVKGAPARGLPLPPPPSRPTPASQLPPPAPPPPGGQERGEHATVTVCRPQQSRSDCDRSAA